MIEFSGGASAGDGNNGVVRVGETASSLAKLREGFAGVSGKKIFVIFETSFGAGRASLLTVAPAKAGAHNHEWLWWGMLELQLA